jgi:hypothetical protein
MKFDRHTLVLLVLRPDAPEMTEAEAAGNVEFRNVPAPRSMAEAPE